MFTWFCQIGATWAGKYIGRRTIILSTWPVLLVALAGLCATGYVTCASASSPVADLKVFIQWRLRKQ